MAKEKTLEIYIPPINIGNIGNIVIFSVRLKKAENSSKPLTNKKKIEQTIFMNKLWKIKGSN